MIMSKYITLTILIRFDILGMNCLEYSERRFQQYLEDLVPLEQERGENSHKHCFIKCTCLVLLKSISEK